MICFIFIINEFIFYTCYWHQRAYSFYFIEWVYWTDYLYLIMRMNIHNN